jgi:anthranilate synthase component 1
MKEVGVYRGKIAGRNVEVRIFSEPIFLDSHTPIGIFERLGKKAQFLLESADPYSKFSRYSFVGGSPSLQAIFASGRLEYKFFDRSLARASDDPLEPLVELAGFEGEGEAGIEGLFGGIVGYISYDAFRYFEPTSTLVERKPEYPEAYFVLPEFIISYDHRRHIANIYLAEVSLDGLKSGSGSPKRKIKEIKETIQKRRDGLTEILPFPEAIGRTTSNFTYDEFIEAVRKAREYIFAGDAYQIVLSQRLSYPKILPAFQVYRYLRVVNPSPYMFYFPAKDLTLVGASPEPLLKVEKRVALTRPIAGTRKRGATAEEDVYLEKDLLSDEKELCEHTMLVDLARNDLYRVCEFKTVAVERSFEVERYSHVMHIVSEVTGRLRSDCTAVEALRSVFPAGTVSGAPKNRACQIISELEPTPRGPYAGAFGYLNFNGDLDTCIIIRTAVVDRRFIHIQAGAGIVKDSVPEKEYQETINKAMGLLEVLVKGVSTHASFNR